MTVPTNTLTYDQTVPHRPGISDLQFEPKENDQVYPPSDLKSPFAQEANQQALQIAAISKVIPIARVHVRTAFGNAFLVSQTDVFGTPIAWTLTRVSAGIVQITTTATLPPPQFPATACLTNTVAGAQQRFIGVSKITNGWQVESWNLGGSASDCDFMITIG